MFNCRGPNRLWKVKISGLNVHGTKDRCELCTRVGESLYSAPFFCGSYFLLLTRVLYLEPPSFRMPASVQKSVYLNTNLLEDNLFEKAILLMHWDNTTVFQKVKRTSGLHALGPHILRYKIIKNQDALVLAVSGHQKTYWKILNGEIVFSFSFSLLILKILLFGANGK